MADRLEIAATRLKTRMKSHASQTVTFVRKSDSETVLLQATFGKRSYQVTDEDGFLVWMDFFDFTFPVADLVFDSVEYKPVEFDIIRVTHGSETIEYQLVPLGDEPPVQYSDQYQTVWRVHTNRIGEAA